MGGGDEGQVGIELLEPARPQSIALPARPTGLSHRGFMPRHFVTDGPLSLLGTGGYSDFTVIVL